MAAPKVFGIVDGGNTNSGTYETIRVPGINQKESFYAGMNKYQPTVSGKYTVDTKLLLAKALRGAGSLGSMDAKYGNVQQGWYSTSGLIDEFELSVGEDQNPITYSMKLMFLAGTAIGTFISEPALTGPPIASFNSIILVGGTDFGIKSAKFSIKNNVEVGSTGSSKATNSLRDPTYIIYSKEQHEIDIVSLMPLGFGAGVDSPLENIGLTAAIGTAGSPSITTTLTYTNLSFTDSFNQPFKEKGVVKYSSKLIGAYTALTLT
jgi:hypothetical protein